MVDSLRLSSLRIDGFGGLSDFSCPRLGADVVVVLGPNEAGKSTLFDFVGGVLFGFPAKKDSPRFRAPIGGGRHGGRLSFVDASGETWTVERHGAPQKTLSVRLPDGTEGDDFSLKRALAGASFGLFKAVFAMDLDALVQIENLESDEVRELLFAASIFGQRRSATSAIKQLADMRDGLARTRSDDGLANRLYRELESTRSELVSVRRTASSYGALRAEVGVLQEDVARVRSELGSARERERELKLLLTCWRPFSEAADARIALAALPESDARPVRQHANEIRQLAAEVSGHEERCTKLQGLRESKQSIEASIARRLELLGPTWTANDVSDSASDVLLGDQAREFRDDLARRTTEVASRRAVLLEASSLCDKAEAELGEATASSGSTTVNSLPDRATLDDKLDAISEMRERLASADQLGNAAAAETDADFARKARLTTVVIAIASAILAAAGVVAVLQREVAIGAVFWVVSALLVAAAVLVHGWPKASGRHRQGVSAGRDSGHGDDSRELLARERSRIEQLACLLQLPNPPSRVDVERLSSKLQRSLELRRKIDDLGSKIDDAKRRAAEASLVLEASVEALSGARQGFLAWCAAHGFEGITEPNDALSAIEHLVAARDRLDALSRVDNEMRLLDELVGNFQKRCALLLEATGSRCSGGTDTPSSTLRRHLGELEAKLDDALESEAQRRSLSDKIAAADMVVREAIGAGQSAGRLRADLESGEILAWEAELNDISGTLDDLARDEEAAVRQHESATRALAEVAGSDRIVVLTQRIAEIEDELDATLTRYLTVAAARALLQRTLSRHERERQPAVIANAAAHFGRVTRGRYTSLLANPGPDGKQAIRVVAANGDVFDAAKLSRGTLEQLYLCIRLGLADSFAQRSVSLPIILDDVLVNFDPERAKAMAGELVASTDTHQIVFMTCHPELAELMELAADRAPVSFECVDLGRIGESSLGEIPRIAAAS